ncbi:MAG: hypothetical protein KAI66_03725, partial [Lentisphaeria bacterium]|nr:hypothetical protein [Lentisphaeria bacterium]
MNDKETAPKVETTEKGVKVTRKKSGKRRWLRRILLVCALTFLMVGALVAALPSILSSDAVCRQVTDRAGKALGCDVR